MFERASESPSISTSVLNASDFDAPAVLLAAETVVAAVESAESTQTENTSLVGQQPQHLPQSRPPSRRPSLLPALSALFSGSLGGGSSGARSPISTSPSPSPNPSNPLLPIQQLVCASGQKGSSCSSGTKTCPVSPCGLATIGASGTERRSAIKRSPGSGNEKDREEVTASPQRCSLTATTPHKISCEAVIVHKKQRSRESPVWERVKRLPAECRRNRRKSSALIGLKGTAASAACTRRTSPVRFRLFTASLRHSLWHG